MGADSNYAAAQLPHSLRQRTAKLRYSLLKCAFATHIYQIRNRLGLCKSIRPLRKARRLNSPGSAILAPADIASPSTRRTINGPP